MNKVETAAPAEQVGGIRVLFVDDHKVMRKGLIQLIANQADIQVAGEAADGSQVARVGIALGDTHRYKQWGFIKAKLFINTP